MIEIKNLTLQRGLKVLLDKANATVNPGQRVGLIGKNGTGKSSLFALIKGKITQDGGDVSIPKNSISAILPNTNSIPSAPTKTLFGIFSSFLPKYANKKSEISSAASILLAIWRYRKPNLFPAEKKPALPLP